MFHPEPQSRSMPHSKIRRWSLLPSLSVVSDMFAGLRRAVTAKKQGRTARLKFAPKSENKNYNHFTPIKGTSQRAEKGGNVKEKQLLRRLQSLQKKTGIDARGQVFGWRIGRKLFLRTCTELGITSWNAQMMCGKAVDKSISTYINGLALKNDAIKVSNVLKMEISNGNGKVTKLEELVVTLQKENQELKLVMRGMATVFGEQILQKAKEQMRKERKEHPEEHPDIAHGVAEPLTP